MTVFFYFHHFNVFYGFNLCAEIAYVCYGGRLFP